MSTMTAAAPAESGASGGWMAREALASVVVFLVALPLCMGIAVASGVPPALGLVSGIIGGIVVGALAGSPLQVSGPAAGLTVIVYDIVQTHGIAMLGPIVALAGLLQVIAGALGGGRLFRAVSPAVIQGMLAGIGVLIASSQLHVVMDGSPKGKGLANLAALPQAFLQGVFPLDGSSHHLAAYVGLGTVAVLLGWTRFAPTRLRAVPAALVAIVAMSAVAAAFELPVKYVNVPTNLFAALSLPGLSDFVAVGTASAISAAVGLAVVASAESLLCAGATDQLHAGPRTQYNRELMAQGVGNTVAGLLGALPLTGVIVRSTANVQAGAETRVSAMLHGVWLLLLVLAFPSVLGLVPTSALAAILVYTGVKLVNLSVFRDLQRAGRGEVATYLATVAGVVFTDLLVGVMIGFALAGVRLLMQVTRLDVAVSELEGSHTEVELSGAATFLGIPKLGEALESLPKGARVVVKLDRVAWIDHGARDHLRTWARQHRRRGGVVEMDESRLAEPRDAAVAPA